MTGGAHKPGAFSGPADGPMREAPFGAQEPATPPDMPAGEHETFYVDSRVIHCDGGSLGLGHPRVWLRIVHQQTYCPYCSRVYILNEGASDSGH